MAAKYDKEKVMAEKMRQLTCTIKGTVKSAMAAGMRRKSMLAGFAACAAALFCPASETPTATLALADPFVLLHDGTYYAYGTHSAHGIAVAVSKDLKTWTLWKGRAGGGLALHKNDSFGGHSFWAPEVYKRGDKFIMFYSAQEHVCAAVADSPLGPFRQTEKKPLLERPGIDNSLFVDNAGRAWMVYVHFDRGNTIWLAELEADWLRVKPGTAKMLFRAEAPWEGNVVAEGPFAVKLESKYVLTYSARDFRDPNYAVGYALADKPEGPWRKSSSNPILRRFRGLCGTGHHSLFKDKDGKWRIVFHAHASPSSVGMRRTYIADLVVAGTPDAPELSVGGELVACMEVK